jgi:SAM-dependent methyltransferase
VGCGTGGLSLRLAQKCRFVLGIDISEKMIRQAEKRIKKENIENVQFLQTDATRIHRDVNEEFDIATFSFVIHEIVHHQRITILKQTAKVSRSLLIYDYHIPLPRNLYGLSPSVIEFFTSGDHFANFKDYRRRGGLDPILQEAGLVVTDEKINHTGIFRLVAAEVP